MMSTFTAKQASALTNQSSDAMSSLRCLFVIQGEGRGHMTQALALQGMLERAGHQVCGVLLGRNPHREVPPFFLHKIDAPVCYFESPSFAFDDRNQAIRSLGTFLKMVQRGKRFWASLNRIDQQIQAHRPDVIINFYEPLMGLYAQWSTPTTPIVCVAHQYMFFHPDYPFHRGHGVQHRLVRAFTKLTAVGASSKLALSLYPAPDLPALGLTVVPPLLRDELFAQPTPQNDPFYLVYLLNAGYAQEILHWHGRHPDVALHCFWDKRDADEVMPYDDTLTFHRLNDVKFLSMMARCRGFITTAGFESVSEALYLGKPLLMVPVEGHYEQQCNAVDAAAAGAGIWSSGFDIDRLVHYRPMRPGPTPAFQNWVHRAEPRFIQAIEAAAGWHSEPAKDPAVEWAVH